jgi:thiopeptide-type bacteriocin biosynthesis protein
VQLDTYEREVERYGGARGIELAEDVFHHDSTTVLCALEGLMAEGLGDERWKFGLAGIANLYEDVGVAADEIWKRVERARDAFTAEFSARPPLFRLLGQRFRLRQSEIHSLIERRAGTETSDAMKLALATLTDRSKKLSSVRAALETSTLTLPASALAWNYAHMFVNRLFSHESRAHEFVLYDMLWRHLASVRARRAQKAVS